MSAFGGLQVGSLLAYLIAREGTVDRARSALSEAGLLPRTEAVG
jgi:hypothetical protein